MECNCGKLECGSCTMEIAIIETTTCYVPRSKYEKLKEKYDVQRLFHINDGLIQLSRDVRRASDEIVVTMLEIDDGEG